MRILYLDCFSGISGDMTVGALRDLGVEEAVFCNAIASLGLGDEIHVHFHRGHRQNIAGWKFDVHGVHGSDGHEHGHSHGHHHHHGDEHGHSHEHERGDGHAHGRSYREIVTLITDSILAEPVKKRAVGAFYRIAVAEGKIHGMPPEEVTFHEVGSADSIADIVAACAGIHALGVDKVMASRLVEGSGWIQCAHGKFPLPAPATLEILSGISLRQTDDPWEFITPTGAALVAEFSESFGPMSEMKIEKTGYGLGGRDTPGRPNVLRAVLGESAVAGATKGEIIQIETNLDDMSPELVSAAMEKLFASGALDVFLTPVTMKKSRPGCLLTVLCESSLQDAMVRILLAETTTFGVRFHRRERVMLERGFREVQTQYGPVRVKLGWLDGELLQTAPEYESCREAALASGASVRQVYLAACAASTA